jgi:hypothetical protein
MLTSFNFGDYCAQSFHCHSWRSVFEKNKRHYAGFG